MAYAQHKEGGVGVNHANGESLAAPYIYFIIAICLPLKLQVCLLISKKYLKILNKPVSITPNAGQGPVYFDIFWIIFFKLTNFSLFFSNYSKDILWITRGKTFMHILSPNISPTNCILTWIFTFYLQKYTSSLHSELKKTLLTK